MVGGWIPSEKGPLKAKLLASKDKILTNPERRDSSPRSVCLCVSLFLRHLTLSPSHALVFSNGPKLQAEFGHPHTLWVGSASLRTSLSCTLMMMNAPSKEPSLRAHLFTSSSPAHPRFPRFQPASASTQKQASVR